MAIPLRPSLGLYLAILRAVDCRGRESANPHCWSMTTTSEVGAAVGMNVQRVTSLLHLLAAEGYVTRTEQQHGAVTWHLLDPAVKLLRGEREIEVVRGGGLARPSAA